MAINVNTANARITDWAKGTEGDLKEEIKSLGIRHRANSKSPMAAVKALKTTYRKGDGIINRISFRIPRHMIFVHKGVGRDTPIEKVGQTNRKAKPWFNPVIDKNIDELADIAAEEIGGAIINNLLIN